MNGKQLVGTYTPLLSTRTANSSCKNKQVNYSIVIIGLEDVHSRSVVPVCVIDLLQYFLPAQFRISGFHCRQSSLHELSTQK